MFKKFTSLVLAASMLGAGAFGAAAAPVGHGSYTPSEGVETYKYYFAKPWGWDNDSTAENNNVPGVYWWDASDSPDDVFDRGWPGYELDREDGYDNLWSVSVPKEAEIVVFNNYLDGGTDTTQSVFLDAIQCKQKNVQFNCEGDSDNYSEKFWKYMWTKAAKQIGYDVDAPDFDYASDEVYMAMLEPENAAKIDFSDELGEYGKNFYVELDYGNGLVFNFQNMVYVVDLDPDHIQYITADQYSGSKPVYDGEFYFMYGNGEYGMWPTKELALRMEGVTQDEDGSYSGGARVDDYGTVYNADGQVVVGSFTGRYATNEPTPEPKKIYFEAPEKWQGVTDVRFYLTNMDAGEAIINWGVKKGKMTDEGNGVWSYDLAAKGITLDENTNYLCAFLTNTDAWTDTILINTPCIGDTAYCPPDQESTEGTFDNASVLAVKWKNADPTQYGTPKSIYLGKVTGEALPKGKTNADLLAEFLTGTGNSGIDKTMELTEKTAQEVIDDLAAELGLTLNDVRSAITNSGRTDLDWDEHSIPKTGDVNRDGEVNGADAGILNRYASGWTGYEDKIKDWNAADVNNDGKVNGADAGILSRYVSGWTQYERYFNYVPV